MASGSKGGGVGFGALLFLLFLGLKLTGHIDWSWWWVFAPFWVPLILLSLCLVVLGIIYLIEERSKR